MNLIGLMALTSIAKMEWRKVESVKKNFATWEGGGGSDVNLILAVKRDGMIYKHCNGLWYSDGLEG